MRFLSRASALSAVALALTLAGSLAGIAPAHADEVRRPGFPTWVHTSASTGRSITVSWLAPTVSGGLPITNYVVEYRQFGYPDWIPVEHVASPSTSIVVTGLEPGATFSFRVSAVNAEGAGEFNVSPSVISTGPSFTCAVTIDGLAHCWGSGGDGTLGDGRGSDSDAPVTVSGIDGLTSSTTAISVAAGGNFACALMLNGSVRCWGTGAAGQLGDGLTTDSLVPVDVVGMDGLSPSGTAVSIVTGDEHACAIVATGAVWCWGYNGNGQLGDGSTNRATAPVLSGIDGGYSAGNVAMSLSAGRSHTCAVLVTGDAQCWGENSSGQLGNGNQVESLTPTNVSGMDSAYSVAAGSFHSCGIRQDGSAACWGGNGDGQLGDSTTDQSDVPQNVTGADGEFPASSVLMLTAGTSSTCGLTHDGLVSCWGWGEDGALGRGSFNSSPKPGWVRGFAGRREGKRAVAIDGHDSSHVCAVTAAGSMFCWGANGTGQLGDGTSDAQSTPTPVPALTGLDASSTVATGATGFTLVVPEPSAPRDVAISIRHANSIAVSWNEPDYTGTSHIDLYRVRYRAQGTATWTSVEAASRLSRHLRIDNLRVGERYTVEVSAHNASGFGTSSAATQVTVPARATAPQAATGSWRSGSITLKWRSATSSDSNPITGYTASCTSRGADTLRNQVEANARSATILAPQNGKYSCRIAAVTAAGRGVGTARVLVRSGA